MLAILFNLELQVRSQEIKKHRPKIGLVLSGGGAEGLAHIGVLKVLEELGIPIDYIAGTSMGSIIGGLYACGYSADQIEEICHKVNWNDIIFDNISRRSLDVEQKDEDSKYVSSFPIVKWKVDIPQGLIAGQNISLILSDLTWSYHKVTNFDQLPIPFCCVATDIETMKPVVLKTGFLPDAIRASMAIPTIFTPVLIDNKLLVDGGLVQNFPVQQAKDMGADIIIGVNIPSPLVKRDQLKSILQIVNQATAYLISMSSDSQIKLCNYYIEPELKQYNIFSFDKADSIISIGENAAKAIYPRLKALADSLNLYPGEYKPVIRTSRKDSVFISEIQIEGLEKVSKNLVLGNLQISVPSWISNQQLDRGIDRIYGSQFFETVTYKIERKGSNSILILRLKEQTRNFFKFSLNYDNNLKVGILLNYTSLNILGQGSRLLVDLKIGDSPAIVSDYNIHTSIKPNIGFGTKFCFNKFQANYFNDQGELLSNFTILHYVTDMEGTSSFSNSNLLTAGLEGEILNVSPLYASQDSLRLNNNFLSLYGRFRMDTYDRTLFPKRGDQVYAEFKYILNENYLSGEHWVPRFWRLLLIYNKATKINDHFTVLTALDAGLLSNINVHPAYLFYLGGLQPYETNIIRFTGLQFMEVSAPNVVSLQAGLRFEPLEDKYITIKSSIATSSMNYDQIANLQKYYAGIGISVGIKTILGPMELTISKGTLSHSLISELEIGYFF